jgi:hypothetical protein
VLDRDPLIAGEGLRLVGPEGEKLSVLDLAPTSEGLHDAHVPAPVAGPVGHQEHLILNHHIRVEEV